MQNAIQFYVALIHVSQEWSSKSECIKKYEKNDNVIY